MPDLHPLFMITDHSRGPLVIARCVCCSLGSQNLLQFIQITTSLIAVDFKLGVAGVPYWF